MKTAERYVLDSFALLAYLEKEPGAAAVVDILAACDQAVAESWMSIINFGEVLYITEREQGLQAAQRVVATIDQVQKRRRGELLRPGPGRLADASTLLGGQ